MKANSIAAVVRTADETQVSFFILVPFIPSN
jgi:hypothetical protein